MPTHLIQKNYIIWNYERQEKEKKDFIEKKKMGRPTRTPRDKRLSLRIAESEMQEIEYCMKELSISKIETVLKGISLLKKQIEKIRNVQRTV